METDDRRPVSVAELARRIGIPPADVCASAATYSVPVWTRLEAVPLGPFDSLPWVAAASRARQKRGEGVLAWDRAPFTGWAAIHPEQPLPPGAHAGMSDLEKTSAFFAHDSRFYDAASEVSVRGRGEVHRFGLLEPDDPAWFLPTLDTLELAGGDIALAERMARDLDHAPAADWGVADPGRFEWRGGVCVKANTLRVLAQGARTLVARMGLSPDVLNGPEPGLKLPSGFDWHALVAMLDPSDPRHAPELSVAVAAWTRFYYSQVPNPATLRNETAAIRKGYQRGRSDKSIDRLTSIALPACLKEGGQPRLKTKG